MRLSLIVVLVVLALIVVCESKPAKKQSKSKDHAVKKSSKPAKANHSKTSNAKHDTKTSKKSKVVEKKGKIAKPKEEKTSSRNHKDKKSSKAKDISTKSKKPANSKTKSEKKSDKSIKIESSIKKENLKTIPKNCDDIVQQYADGQMVMYEYKIKMAKCLKAEKTSEATITSKYEDNVQKNEEFFRKAMKKYTEDDDDDEQLYDNDNDNDSYNDSDKEEKKSEVPSSDVVNTQVPQQKAASLYYPSQDQSNLDQAQAQAPAQANAAFSQNPVYNQAAPAQQNYNYYARSNIPAAPQDANQQWNTANAASALLQVDTNTKKDTLPAAPNSDAFAQFMNIQSSPDTAPQPIQQRSDIPSDQSYNTIPANQQAYFRQQYRFWSPEDDGIFPENP